MIEEFFKSYQHTIAAIAAAGTMAAVVTSLALAFLARRADRTRLRAFASLMTLVHPTIDPKTAPEFLRVSITNEGKWPLRIPASFFYWKIPFRRAHRVVLLPLDLAVGQQFWKNAPSDWIPKKTYPREVAPRTSESFFMSDLATFKTEVKRMRGADTFADWLRFRFINAFVETDDGKTFRVKLSPDVREVWSGHT